MKTTKSLPLIALISSAAMIAAYIFLLIKFLPGHVNAASTISIHLYTQLVLLFILITVRHITVKINRDNRFRIVLPLLIITQSLIFVTSALMVYKVAEIKFVYFFPAIALILLILFLWFTILILLPVKIKYNGIKWLKGFAAAFIFFFLIRITFLIVTSFDLGESVTMEDIQAYNTFLRMGEKLPYIFLLPFFFKNLNYTLPETGN
jgi:hypothetical protein